MILKDRFIEAVGALVGRHDRDMTAMRKRAEGAESERDTIQAEFDTHKVTYSTVAFDQLRSDHTSLQSDYDAIVIAEADLRSEFTKAIDHLESLVPAPVVVAPADVVVEAQPGN